MKTKDKCKESLSRRALDQTSTARLGPQAARRLALFLLVCGAVESPVATKPRMLSLQVTRGTTANASSLFGLH